MSTHTSEPKCDRCQTPMERYAVPGTGGKEQAWRLACPCQHSTTPDVARASKERSVAEIVRHSDLLLESGDEVLCLTPHEWQQIKAEIDRLRAHRNICVQHLRLGAEQIRRADQRLSPYYMDQAKLLRIAVILDSAAKNAMADEPPAHETEVGVPVCIEVGNWYSEYECPRCKVRWVQNDDAPTHKHTCAPAQKALACTCPVPSSKPNDSHRAECPVVQPLERASDEIRDLACCDTFVRESASEFCATCGYTNLDHLRKRSSQGKPE